MSAHFYYNIVFFDVVHRKKIEHCSTKGIFIISINLLEVYRESVNLIGYITRRLSADSLQL